MKSRTKFEVVDTDCQPPPEGKIMKTQKWIDEQPGYAVGSAGFLIEFSNENTGGSRFSLDDRPPYTNQSHEPRLSGWCGSYNNVGTYGRGAWRVVKEAQNGRLKIEKLAGDELGDFLEAMGYPELNPAALAL